MTRRQKIMSLITGYLGDITIANGYLTDAGNSVSHWGTQIIQRDKASGVDLEVRDKINEHGYGPEHSEVLTIEITIGLKIASTYSFVMNVFSDILKCLDANEAALGTAMSDNVMRFYPMSETVDIEQINEAEFGKSILVVDLKHKVDEKWTVDNTSY